ncbi:molybdate ABC transporter substrate-binding protein [Bengtsoniella intestinalis]|uniref:molybdate ABC transporter substrate-binding protein n=1 Tax=Bengtsoniella intestinalis TaxID=3073143 RepID=UPI00391FABC3
MRRIFAGLLAALLLSGCTSQSATVEVFAAASLTETMDALIAMYETEHPEVDVVATYDSSGTLRRQIDEGASCDVFFSASWTQVEGMEAMALLENQLVLVVPENGSGVTSFEDLIRGDFTLLAIGNSDVPAGAYATEVLDSLGVSLADLEADGKVSYGSNVREVLTQVAYTMVDCAMVYATDCVGSSVEIVAVADGSWYSPAIYPMAVLSDDEDVASFAAFLQSDTAKTVFVEAGFALAT